MKVTVTIWFIVSWIIVAQDNKDEASSTLNPLSELLPSAAWLQISIISLDVCSANALSSAAEVSLSISSVFSFLQPANAITESAAANRYFNSDFLMALGF